MDLYEATVPVFKKMLTNLGLWLEAGAAYAEQKKFDPNVLAVARLAPDQYPLIKQVQGACDAAKTAGARLAGNTPPSHPDTEQTLAELRTRVATCLAFLDTVKQADFAGAEERQLELPFMPGKLIKGSDYVKELALPNFYFHVTTAYAILRHNGVDLGKAHFIGGLTLRDK
jgi:hypothetical protein